MTCCGHWATSLVIFVAVFPGGKWHLVWLRGHASSSASSLGASALGSPASVEGLCSSWSPMRAVSDPVVRVAAYVASGIGVPSHLTSILTTAVPSSSWSERRGTLSPLIVTGKQGPRGDRGLIGSFGFHSLCYCLCYFRM